MLTIQLFGEFHLADNNTVIAALNQTRVQSLLVYLLLHSHAAQSRQHLAFLFWPDSSEAQARANLRQTLYHLRHALPDADRYLYLDAQSVQWLPKAPISIDVLEFSEQLRQAENARQNHQAEKESAALQRAVDRYQGDLLPGCYDDWIIPEREQRREQFINALDRLIQLGEEARDYPTAITYAQRLLRHDPRTKAPIGV